MKLISACLLGINCKYNGKNNLENLGSDIYKEFLHGKLIPVCPEQLGGLTTPRLRAQIQNGDGFDVLNNKAQVITEEGQNITKQFIRGAQEALKIAQTLNIKEAILKQRSPSCGCGKIYDGSFSGKLIDGDGVTAALLKQYSIRVISEED
jgi:uncharacterized protein YbbK (DUF523 family)